MTLEEFSERVAHYCDEKQIEDEDYFLTAVNGAIREIAQRFPEVEVLKISCVKDSQTAVKMREAVDDFASFSLPPVRVNGVYLPDGCPLLDTRLGEIVIPEGYEGEAEIFYNRAMPRLDRDFMESGTEIPLEDDKVELAILLVAYRLLIIDEDRKAASVKVLYDEAAYRLEERASGVTVGFRCLDGWA